MPSLSASKTGGGYVVESYVSPAAWVSGSYDTVANPTAAGLSLAFTTADWNVPQTVYAVGLDNYFADGTVRSPAQSTNKRWGSRTTLIASIIVERLCPNIDPPLMLPLLPPNSRTRR